MTAESVFNNKIYETVDFKKASDRVWHAALWATMRLYNINTNLINAIQNFYDKATSAVCFNGSTGGWFRTAVGVGQGCLLSPTLFSIFLERIMAHALDDHKSTVSIGGRTISNSSFADDIDGLTGSELELANLVERLGETSTAYGMRVSAGRAGLETNNTNGVSGNARVNSERLEAVQSFKYLGAMVTDEGSMPEIRSRIAQTIAALTKLKIIWDDKNIDLSSKIRLLRSVVMSIFLYSCEAWTLTAEMERMIRTLEVGGFRRFLGIPYKDHMAGEEVRSGIRRAVGPYKELLSTIKRRKMKWYGHVTRASGLAETVLHGTVREGRRRGKQRKRWEDNIRDWTGLEVSDAVRRAEKREEWRLMVARSCGALTVPKTMG